MDEVLVPLGFFALVAYIAKLIRDTRVRRKALESPLSEERIEELLDQGGWADPSTRAALKWGLVILSLGVGLLLVELLAISFESPVAYAVLLLATGIALLGYYLVERDDKAEDKGNGPFSPRDAPSPESVGESEL